MLFKSKLPSLSRPTSDIFNYIFHHGRRAYPWHRMIYRVDQTDITSTLAGLEEKSRQVARSIVSTYDIKPNDVVAIFVETRLEQAKVKLLITEADSLSMAEGTSVLAGCVSIVSLDRADQSTTCIEDLIEMGDPSVSPFEIKELANVGVPASDVSNVKWLLSAGAPMHTKLREAVSAKFSGTHRTLEWGTSETMLIAIQIDEESRRPGSSGTLVNGVQAKVIDTESGEELGQNEMGKLLVPNSVAQFAGCKDNNAANQAFDAEGWFHTGDYGFLDDNCTVYIIYRLKEVLRVGDGYGSHMSAAELETVVFEHPSVASAVVVGIHNDRTQIDEPTAFVVLKHEFQARAGRVLAEDIETFAAGKLIGLKRLTGGIYFISKYPTVGAARGERFILQGGDCAESFEDVRLDIINSKASLLTQQGNLIESKLLLPVTCIGRIAEPEQLHWTESASLAHNKISTKTRPFAVSQILPRAILTSNEALLLPYESSLTRGRYCTSATFLWVGERTRQLDGAHDEYLRGLRNPIGVKLSSKASPKELIALLDKMCQDELDDSGRVTLITRLGAQIVNSALPPFVKVVQASGHRPVWTSDPCHGNTITAKEAKSKTRCAMTMLDELQQTHAIHRSLGFVLSSLHVEQTGESMVECVEHIAMGTSDLSLGLNYRTLCDPRLYQSKQCSQQAITHAPAVIVEQDSNTVPYGLGSNHHVGHSTQSLSPPEEVEVMVQAPIHTNQEWTVTFDSLPSGDWDPDTVVNNSFKLQSGTSARIYDVSHAFPNLPVEHRHVWGAFPTGSSLAIKFVDGIHKYSSVRFGWVVNQQLATAEWTAATYKAGKFVASNGGTTPARWAGIRNPGFEHDEWRVDVKSDIVSGILVVQSFTVDDPISAAIYDCQDAHTGL
ncbi:MAG: hypothetical protein Q9217_005116 [Psora testacea]